MTNLIQIKSADDISEDMVGRPALFVHKASGMEEWEILERGFIGNFEYAAKHHYIYLAPTLEELQNQAAVIAQAKEALEGLREATGEGVSVRTIYEFGDYITITDQVIECETALAAYEAMEKGKSKIIPDDICGLCYHPKTESNSCTRPDCNLGGEHE